MYFDFGKLIILTELHKNSVYVRNDWKLYILLSVYVL